uniref:Programmed cell death 7 n=1 Tax=Cyprinodon variegatus TaxID=28743 RepID=A0A3Q2EE95_CYPVA
MEAFYPRAQAEAPQHHVSGGGIYYPSSEQPNHTPPPWIPPSANFPAPPPGGAAAAFGGSRFPPPYGFGPPPPFGCPPPGHLPGSAPARADCGDGGLLYRGPQHLLQERSSGWEPEPEDEEELQRKQDRRWVARLVGGRGARAPQRPEGGSLPAFREALYGAAGLLSRLQHLCGLLQELLQEAGGGWAESYQMALEAKTELQQELQRLSDPHRLNQLKAKGARIARRRARSLRAKKELQMEEKLAADLSSEKEASIDKWRSRQIQKEEEKKKVIVSSLEMLMRHYRQSRRARRWDPFSTWISALFRRHVPPLSDYSPPLPHSLDPRRIEQTTRDWDAFLVSGDHPDGSSVPQNWVLPDSPSDQTWASALQAAEDDL